MKTSLFRSCCRRSCRMRICSLMYVAVSLCTTTRSSLSRRLTPCCGTHVRGFGQEATSLAPPLMPMSWCKDTHKQTNKQNKNDQSPAIYILFYWFNDCSLAELNITQHTKRVSGSHPWHLETLPRISSQTIDQHLIFPFLLKHLTTNKLISNRHINYKIIRSMLSWGSSSCHVTCLEDDKVDMSMISVLTGVILF